jgi:hypothetical protein
MCAGFLWFIAREQKGRSAEPAVLMMVLAGFIKHNTIAVPAAALVWLALQSPRRAARAAVFGAAACALGLLVCRAAYGKNFIEQLAMPRHMSLSNSQLPMTSPELLMTATAIVAFWLWHDRRRLLARRMAALLLLTFVSGFVQRFGDGVDINAYFEFLFALAVGVGIAFGKLDALLLAGRAGTDALRLAAAALLVAGLLPSLQATPYRLIWSKEFREELADNAAAVASEVKRIKKIHGKVSCTVTLVCYWAGKPFVWDDFAMKQRVSTGRWTQDEVDRRARANNIRFETIDDRTVW